MSGTETQEGKHTSQTELAVLMSAVTLTGYLFIDMLHLQLSSVHGVRECLAVLPLLLHLGAVNSTWNSRYSEKKNMVDGEYQSAIPGARVQILLSWVSEGR